MIQNDSQHSCNVVKIFSSSLMLWKYKLESLFPASIVRYHDICVMFSWLNIKLSVEGYSLSRKCLIRNKPILIKESMTTLILRNVHKASRFSDTKWWPWQRTSSVVKIFSSLLMRVKNNKYSQSRIIFVS